MENVSVSANSSLTTQSNRILVMIALVLGMIFSELDETVVNTALPTIIRDLGGLSFYGWVAGVYMLSMSAFMPILGKLADLFGRKKIYLLAMSLFISGSIICGLSDSMTLLLIGRGIQGMGAGGLMPLAMTISSDLFPIEQRAKVQGFMGPIMFIPMLLGPMMGGLFVDQLSWHWIFFINIPVGLLAAVLLVFGLKESNQPKKVVIDWAGAFLLMAAIVCLLITPVLVENQGLACSSPLILGMIFLGVVMIGIFIWVESKAKEPIIPLHLFKNRNILVLSLIVFTVGVGLMGAFSSFPYYVQHVLGLTPTNAGYLMLPMMTGAIISSIVCGFLLTKVRYRELMAIGFIFPVVGFYLFAHLNLSTTIVQIIFFFLITGLGLGVLFGGDNLIIQESVEEKHKGVALATVPLFQTIGATVGVSVFGTLLSSSLMSQLKQIGHGLTNVSDIASGQIPAHLPSDVVILIKTAIAESFQHIYLYAFILTVIAFVLCWFLKKEVLLSSKDKQGSNNTVK